ncbi:acetyltransferase [Vibrio mimicus]
MVTVVVFEFSVMRCQPLRRALAVFRNPPNPREGKCTN